MGSEEVTLGSICTAICTGGTPKSNIADYYENGTIPWLNTKEVSFNRIRTTHSYITSDGYKASSAKWIKPNTVIVAMYGATAGKSAITLVPVTTNQACCNCEINPNKADFRFVYYWLKDHYSEIAGLANGGAQQNLNVQTIRNIKLNIPDLYKQHVIAQILWSIDDKIELNQRINDYLSKSAEIEFQRRFRNCKYRVSLGSVVDISTKVLKPQDSLCAIWEHYSIPAYDENRRPVFEYADNIKSNKYIVDENSILISKLNPSIKRILWPLCLSSNAVCSTEFIVYKPRQRAYKSFYYAAIDDPSFSDFLLTHVTGSTGSRQRTQPKTTMNYQIAAPGDEAIKSYCDFANPIYQQIRVNTIESWKLERLRDMLLPRLMSGEIDVSQVELGS